MNLFSLFSATVTCALLGLSAALPRPQIVGGEDAEPGEILYQIRINAYSFVWVDCEGALVTAEGKQFVLTNVRCIEWMDFWGLWRFDLFAGELSAGEESDKVQVRKANRFFISEDWNESTYVGDLAILGLEHPFNVTDTVQPIPIASQGQNTTGEVLISGFGTRSNGPDPYRLQKLKLPVISDEECSALYGREHSNFDPHPSMLCAKDPRESGCHCADVGGPVKSIEGGYLAGIISYPIVCKGCDDPDVYTEISHYSDWIKQKARDL